MTTRNEITNYFKRTKKNFNKKSLLKERNNQKINNTNLLHGETDSDNDCIIVENDSKVNNLLNETAKRECQKMEIEENSENICVATENSAVCSTVRIKSENVLPSVNITNVVSVYSAQSTSKPNDTIGLDDSNDFDTLISSSQKVEPIPTDDLDKTLLTIKEEELDISFQEEWHMELGLSNNFASNISEGGAVEKTRKRVGIRRNGDYYTKFMFRMVIQFMKNKELHHLFKDDDLKIIKSFRKLKSQGAQILFARIYWRTPTYKSTAEVISKYLRVNFNCKAVRDMIQSLKAAKLLNDKPMDLEAWCGLKHRADLIRHFKPYLKDVKYSKMSKCEIIEKIKKACNPKNDISKHFILKGNKVQETPAKQLMDKLTQSEDYVIIHDAAKSAFDRLHLLMYAGVNPQIMREKRLNLLLLNVLNKLQRFPALEMETDSVATVFPTREYFEAYVEAYSLFEIVSGTKDKKNQDLEGWVTKCVSCIAALNSDENIAQFDPPIWHLRFSPFSLYYKTIELCVPAMRADEANCSLAIKVLETLLPETKFRQHKKALLYAELVQCHIKMKNHAESANVLERALCDPSLSWDDKAPLCDKAQSLAAMVSAKLNEATKEKLLKLSHQVRPEIPSIQVFGRMVESENKRLTYEIYDPTSGSTTYTNVEDFAIHYYVNMSGEYTAGQHWEGSIVTSIFALAFWDIIYSEMPGKGIFISPYQDLPLDMYTPAFYENRREMIEQRLETIQTSNINEVLKMMGVVYQERKSGDFSLYNDQIPWNILHEVVICLGSSGLHAICKRLAENYYYTHSGFPDLTVWDETFKTIKFVEVKSHNDKLSPKQIQWMQYMLQHGIDTEVCFVAPNQTKMDVSSKINRQSSSSVREVLQKKANKKKANRRGKKQNKVANNEENESGNFEKQVKRGRKKKSPNKTDNDDAKLRETKISNGSIKKKSPIKKQTKAKRVKTVGGNKSGAEPSTSKDLFSIGAINKTPSKNGNLVKSPLKNDNKSLGITPSSSSSSNCSIGMRTPTKFYSVSPTKSEHSSPLSGQSKSPYKNLSPKRKISLSLTRRRLTDLDK